VMILGVGDDGHTASLFPGEPTVHEQTRLVVAVPAKGAREARMTITPLVIERSVALFVLVTGAGKSAPLDRAWSTRGTLDETPSRVVRTARGGVTWIIDRAAGGIDS